MKVKNVILVSFLLLVLPAAILLADSYADETITVNITVEKYVDITLNESVGLSLEGVGDGSSQSNFQILANFDYNVEIDSNKREETIAGDKNGFLPYAERVGSDDKIFYDVEVRTGKNNASPKGSFSSVGVADPISIAGQAPGKTEWYNLLITSQFQDYAGDLDLALEGEYVGELTVTVVER